MTRPIPISSPKFTRRCLRLARIRRQSPANFMPNLPKIALAHELLRKTGAAHLRMREMAVIIQRALRAGCDPNERHAHRRIAGGPGEAIAAARTARADQDLRPSDG